MIDTSLTPDNPLRFKKESFRKNIILTTAITYKIRYEKLKHDMKLHKY